MDRLLYGIKESDWNRIIPVFSGNQKIEKVVLFGSRAKGNFQNGSDVDLAIFGNDLKLNDIIDVSLEIDNLLLPYKFDLINYGRIKEEALKDHISRVGIIIYKKN